MCPVLGVLPALPLGRVGVTHRPLGARRGPRDVPVRGLNRPFPRLGGSVPAINETRQVPAAGTPLTADIARPDEAKGLVLFAHGSGSSRHSPRNRAVAAELQQAGLATVLVDLLTPDEERLDASSGQLRFDINLLAA